VPGACREKNRAIDLACESFWYNRTGSGLRDGVSVWFVLVTGEQIRLYEAHEISQSFIGFYEKRSNEVRLI